jgi:hypothetical protein
MNSKRKFDISLWRGARPVPLRQGISAIALGALSLAIQLLFGVPLPIPMAIFIVRSKIVLKR